MNKNNIPKLLSVFCAVCVLLLGVPVCAAENDGSADIEWSVSDGVLTVTPASDTAKIPDYEYGTATPWNDLSSEIKGVVICEGITYIGENAFKKCSAVTSVQLPQSLETIGTDAFSYCTALSEISLPNGLKKIYSGAFASSGLTSIDIPDSVEYFGFSVFSECSELITVKFGEGIKQLPGFSFVRCTALREVVLPEGLETICENAFVACTALEKLHIPSRVKTISSSALPPNRSYYSSTDSFTFSEITVDGNNPYFSSENGVLYNKDRTVLITYPCGKSETEFAVLDGVNEIGYGAFTESLALQSVTLPESVSVIGTNAFKKCTALQNIICNGSIESLGSGAFVDTAFFKNSSNWENGVLYFTDWAAAVKRSTESVSIKNGTRAVTDGPFVSEGFSSTNYVKTVSLPESLRVIPEGVFGECRKLEAISVDPNNPDYYSLSGALLSKDKILRYPPKKSDEVFTVPEGITKIGKSAFADAQKLKTVNIASTVTVIGEKAFSGCSALENAVLPNGITDIEYSAFSDCSKLTEMLLPESLQNLGSDVFYYCTSLKSMVIPKKIKVIDSFMFYSCSSLEKVILPEGVTQINGFAFYRCPIKYIELPNSVNKIEYDAFKECSALEYVYLPSALTDIGDSAFEGCSALSDIYYGGSEADFSEITILHTNDPLTAAVLHPNTACRGDINGDGAIDIRDIVRFKHGLANSSALPEYSAELDRVSGINGDDLVALRKYLLGAAAGF